MTWFRLPLFVWAHYATSLIMILGTPVLAITLLLLAFERVLRVGIFDPTIGGDPVLFQHLFWFYSHPAVYIMILPGMGIISEIIAAFSRKNIFGYSFVAFSSLAIAVIGFLVWGHHLFVAGETPYSALVFSILTYLVAVPSAVKMFNWTATLYKGSISYETPMLYAFGFIGLFPIGGLTGLFLATLGLDIHLTDTYFVVAHFHYVMVGGTVMAFLGGLHYWWPKMTGRMYPEGWAKLSALLVFVGFNLTFFPQFILGYQGMPRRYAMYPPEFQVFNVLSTAGATILGVGLPVPDGLPALVAEVREGRWRQSVGREGARVGDDVSAADVQLRPGAHRDRRDAQLRAAPRRSKLPEAAIAEAGAHAHHPGCVITSTRSGSRRLRPAWACGCSSPQEIMFFGGMFTAYLIYRMWYPAGYAAASNELDLTLGGINTVVLIASSLTVAHGRPLRTGRQAEVRSSGSSRAPSSSAWSSS